MDEYTSLPIGQHEARTRWGTQESGAAFDRKKTASLSQQAQEFLACQTLCVVAGLDTDRELCGLLAVGQPGFIQTPDSQTCLLQLDHQYAASRLVQGVRHSLCAGLGLFFINHMTRERLCVQGMAELLADSMPDPSSSAHPSSSIQVRLYVRQTFFHCAKYIRTRVSGLTAPAINSSPQQWRPQELHGWSHPYLSEAIRAFIQQQVLCFLCTVDADGQCAVNHRGGAPGFLVTVPPSEVAPGGLLLLPDYAGNGAFEAVGNILETGRAALLIPDYTAQLALYVSGPACIVERAALSMHVAHRCSGAERIVALLVQRVEVQSGDWSVPLAYERARAEAVWAPRTPTMACPR